MEENKFYTPTIDEFYTGFEYEFSGYCSKINTRIWNKRIYDYDSHLTWHSGGIDFDLPYEIKSNQIRVKYLDSDDIQELGFQPNEWFINKHEYGGTFMIRRIGSSMKIEITSKDYLRDTSGNFELNRIFYGYIKNKSELKKLLKQLNIE